MRKCCLKFAGFMAAFQFMWLTASCGVTHPPGQQLEATGTCSLVSSQQMTSIVGKRVTGVARKGETGECTYFAQGVPVVTVDRFVGENAVNREQSAWASSEEIPGAIVKPIAGTPTLWLPYPRGAGGGGRLLASHNSLAYSVSVTAALEDPEKLSDAILRRIFTHDDVPSIK